MRIPHRVTRAVVVLAILPAAIGASRHAARPVRDSYRPVIDPAQFQAVIDNLYFPLAPGTTYKLEEKSRRGTNEEEVAVTRETRVIRGVTCVVVHDRLTHGGTLVEDTFDWYAQDRLGNVWYFGEDSKEWGSGGSVSTAGSWEAGVGGAQPGIVMRARPVLGASYRQEYYPGEAEDMGRDISVHETARVPYGHFTGCLRVKEWSRLEPGTASKWYARGVGLVREVSGDEVTSLISMTRQ